MKLIIFTILFVGSCVADAQAGLVTNLLTDVGNVGEFVEVILSLARVSVKLHDTASAVTRTADAVNIDQQNVFPNARKYIQPMTYVNQGLADLVTYLTNLDTAIDRIDETPPGFGNPDNLQPILDAMAAGFNQFSASLGNLARAADAVTSELSISTSDLSAVLIYVRIRLEQVCAAIQTTTKAVEQYAIDIGPQYDSWFRMAVQSSGIIGGFDDTAGAVSYLSLELINKIDEAGAAGPTLTDMANNLEDVEDELIVTADSLGNV